MPTGSIQPIPNRLLAALPRKEYLKLLPALEPVRLTFKSVLYEAGAVIENVYFPENALVSLLTLVNPGPAAEVGLVGFEGAVGSAAAFGWCFPHSKQWCKGA